MELKHISRACGAFRSKYRMVLMQGGLLRFLLVILVVGIFTAFFDWMFHFNTFVRFMILLGAASAGALIFWWTAFSAMKKTWTDIQILAYLDRTEDVDKRGILELYELIKAEGIQETQSELGKSFLKQAIEELKDRLNKVSYSKALKIGGFLRWVAAVGVLLGVIAVCFVISPEKAKVGTIRYLNPFTMMDWPSRTKIMVYMPQSYTITVKTTDEATKEKKTQEFRFDNVKESAFDLVAGNESSNAIYIPDEKVSTKQFKFVVTLDGVFVEDLGTENETQFNGQKLTEKTKYEVDKDVITVGTSEISMTQKEKTPWSIPQGEAVKVNALVSGDIPSQATLHYKSKDSGLKIKEKVNIAKTGVLEYTFPSVKDELTFYITAGDYETRSNTITIIQRPFLKKITADYQYPPYAGVPNKKVESGQITGLEGTKVILTFESSMELSKAIFNLEEVGREDLKKINETTFTKELLLEKNGAYSIELYEKSGFRESKPERFEIKVDPDSKPEIEMLAPGRNLIETKNASIEISFRATDDFGIKTLGVYYKVGHDGQYKLLDNKITGPIAIGGKKSEVRFDWDLRKMDIPESSTVYYYIKAQDVNPTNKGITQTNEYEIDLVKPSVFHQEAVLKAKALLTEAMIAYRSQYDAYKEGQVWASKAENKVDDPVWQSMYDKQEAAVRAVDAMNGHISILVDKYERNRMQKEFMSVRLNSIVTDMRTMNEKEMSVARNKMRDANPKSDADAARIKDIRVSALRGFEMNQKMSVLYMERILRKLFDWRDLQDTTIKSTDIYERQLDIMGRTIALAPKLIGKEFLDLSDEEQTELTDLGKQQKSIYDAETSLEQMLEYLMVRAKINKRKSIQAPLDVAFKNLRQQRVNDSLKRIVQLIDDNQCSQVTGDQKKITDVVNVVRGGLVQAGMVVEPDQPLNGNVEIEIASNLEDPVEDPGKGKEKPKAATPTEVSESDEDADKEESPQEELRRLIEGNDPLSTSILYTIDMESKVRARLKYVSSLKSDKVMPRLVRMKIKRMEELQMSSGDVIQQAIEVAEKEKQQFILTELKRIKDFFAESNKLIAVKDLSESHQLFIDSCTAHLSNLVQLIAKDKEIKGVVEEHKRLEGKDSFGRNYLAQEADIASLAISSIDLFEASIYQSFVNDSMERFVKNPASSAEGKALDGKVRGIVADLQLNVKTRFDAEKGRTDKLAEVVKNKYIAYDNYHIFAVDVAKLAGAIKSGSDDAATAGEVKSLNSDLHSFIQNLKDLMDEREKQEEKKVEIAVDTIKEEDFEKMKSADYIKGLIEKSNLSADQKDILNRSLSQEFKGKYKDLLAAYFRNIAEDAGGQ